jgi:hypothetical protein
LPFREKTPPCAFAPPSPQGGGVNSERLFASNGASNAGIGSSQRGAADKPLPLVGRGWGRVLLSFSEFYPSGNCSISARNAPRSSEPARGERPPAMVWNSIGVIAQKFVGGSRSRQRPTCRTRRQGKGAGGLQSDMSEMPPAAASGGPGRLPPGPPGMSPSADRGQPRHKPRCRHGCRPLRRPHRRKRCRHREARHR